MALGTPVIATDCPSGPSEILGQGRYGRLVPMGDHVTLAQAIESALDAAGPVNGGLERAAQFSSERIAAE